MHLRSIPPPCVQIITVIFLFFHLYNALLYGHKTESLSSCNKHKYCQYFTHFFVDFCLLPSPHPVFFRASFIGPYRTSRKRGAKRKQTNFLFFSSAVYTHTLCALRISCRQNTHLIRCDG